MKRPLQRRTLLKVAAAGLALPFLGIRRGLAQDAATPPLRFLSIIDPYGFHGERDTYWIRDGGLDYPLVEEDFGWFLEPMARHASLMTVMSGIEMSSRRELGGGASHQAIDMHTLTGSRGSNDQHVHASIDAHIGQFLRQAAESRGAPRLYEHIVTGGGADGATGESSYSFTSSGVRTQPTRFARDIYAQAFGINTKERLASHSAVMEEVRRQVQRVRPELVHANAATAMDAYEWSVDEVARGIALRLEQQCDTTVPLGLSTALDVNNVSQLFDATYDLFACDLVSSVTFGHPRLMRHGPLRGAEHSDNAAVQTRVNRSFHNMSHGTTAVETLTQGLVWRWRFELLANLVDRLLATPDVDGSSNLMDNTVIFFTSSMSNNTHGTYNSYPTFLVGGRNTNLRTGWHLNCAGRTNNELLATVGQAVTAPTTTFGGYTAAGVYRGDPINSGPIEAALHTLFA